MKIHPGERTLAHATICEPETCGRPRAGTPEAVSAKRFPELERSPDAIRRSGFFDPGRQTWSASTSLARSRSVAATPRVTATSSRDGRRPQPRRECRLRRLHEEIPSWPSYWAYNLEGSYAPRADLETLVALGRPGSMSTGAAGRWSGLPTATPRTSGWVLVNRPLSSRESIRGRSSCDVPAPVLQAKMRPQIENFLVDLRTWASLRHLVDAAIRRRSQQPDALHPRTRRGDLQTRALKWAAETLPLEWRDLIEQVRQDRFVQWNEPPRPGSVERTLAFLDHVQERARSGTR